MLECRLSTCLIVHEEAVVKLKGVIRCVADQVQQALKPSATNLSFVSFLDWITILNSDQVSSHEITVFRYLMKNR
jgi:hypothetical protein